ncbi:hypothetical protein [Lacticaseibacillus yichunensis]|uniref:hypothetical protein n=1 Tax=Lacticaseibacillus yichunensis TaxID=2486015 RepID=UPI0013DE4BA3|nr:hypothetical protein [Lacticaseibacillus yichunensis]
MRKNVGSQLRLASFFALKIGIWRISLSRETAIIETALFESIFFASGKTRVQ